MTVATDERGNTIYRLTPVEVPVEEVIEGDLLFGTKVVHSEPHSDWIWSVTTLTNDEQAGIHLQMTKGLTLTITRAVPLHENQCIDCGREGVKYAARHQCAMCYQRERRTARRTAKPVRYSDQVLFDLASG